MPWELVAFTKHEAKRKIRSNPNFSDVQFSGNKVLRNGRVIGTIEYYEGTGYWFIPKESGIQIPDENLLDKIKKRLNIFKERFKAMADGSVRKKPHLGGLSLEEKKKLRKYGITV